jgi:murein DD-endopeptidase MepM/ murein hydrolase activator NlpD
MLVGRRLRLALGVAALFALGVIFAFSGCEKVSPRPPAPPAAAPEGSPPAAADVAAPEWSPEPPAPTPAGSPIEHVVQGGDTLATALAGTGLAAAEIARVTAALERVRFPFQKIKKDQEFTLWLDDAGACVGFDYRFSPALTYEARVKEGELVAQKVELPTAVRIVKFGARVESSVYEAILQHGETDGLASLVSNLFACDIDFYADPRKGDGFKLIFEKAYLPDGRARGYGRLLAAEYDGAVTGRQRGFWLEHDSEDVRGFYDERGRMLRKTFLAAPLDTMRVTSAFGMRRHPVLGRAMMHNGVDYGAPVGTPVWAVADGVVLSAGGAGAAGNLIKIFHGNGLVTMYMHLSRVMVRQGQRVRQRQMIGRVGATGRVTGAHLDFRVQKDNHFLNPQRLKMIATSLRNVPEAERPRFDKIMAEMQAQLETIEIDAPAKVE